MEYNSGARGRSVKFSQSARLLEMHGFRIVDHPMIELAYSLVIEATAEPDYFGLYSPDLEGFTGIGHSVEDCLYKAKWGTKEHVALLKERGLAVPEPNPDPRITIQNAKEPAVA